MILKMNTKELMVLYLKACIFIIHSPCKVVFYAYSTPSLVVSQVHFQIKMNMPSSP